MDVKSSGEIQLEVPEAIYVKRKVSWKYGKRRLLFFLSSACLSFHVRVHDSNNLIPCTGSTSVGGLTGNFILIKKNTSLKLGSVYIQT